MVRSTFSSSTREQSLLAPPNPLSHLPVRRNLAGFGEELGAGSGDSLAAALVGKLITEDKVGRFLTLEGVTRDEPPRVDRETPAAPTPISNTPSSRRWPASGPGLKGP